MVAEGGVPLHTVTCRILLVEIISLKQFLVNQNIFIFSRAISRNSGATCFSPWYQCVLMYAGLLIWAVACGHLQFIFKNKVFCRYIFMTKYLFLNTLFFKIYHYFQPPSQSADCAGFESRHQPQQTIIRNPWQDQNLRAQGRDAMLVNILISLPVSLFTNSIASILSHEGRYLNS